MNVFMPLPPDGAPPFRHRHTTDSLSTAKKRSTAQQGARTGPPSDAGPGVDSPPQNGASDLPERQEVPRKNIVFPDPVAFRYLEEDPCVKVVERRGSLRGYELYLVEQWACSRQSPTLVIITYTGDMGHSVIAGVLSVPEDESLWSPRLRVYFKASRKYLARPKETDLGELMITNLSSFPSALTVIPVPDGDIRKHRKVFVVNENLKRMGCSGRSGLTLSEPAEGTQAKFLSVYKVSDRIPFHTAVTELVKLCQVALYMFEKLEPEYIDGLLCDVTEKAIGNWWTEVGVEHYNFEPNDGILGPTTVAALLGMLMGARNRLYWCGAPVGKDVFDIEATKRGIAYFQKLFKLERTRRLDRPTILKLYLTTAKAAAGEGWGVPKAVKSRMTEIGGKRGEIVMGMVSGKDKGGLADIETLDIDSFVNFVYGERAKWLWFGKPRRKITDYSYRDMDRANPSFGVDVDGGQAMTRTRTLQPEDKLDMRRREELQPTHSETPTGTLPNVLDSPAEKDPSRRNVLKSVTGRMNDARSGFGRIKDAVGGSRRGHGSRPSISARDDALDTGGAQIGGSVAQGSSLASTPSLAVQGKAFTWKNKPEEYLGGRRRSEQQDSTPHSLASDSQPYSSPAVNPRGLEAKLNNIGTDVRRGIHVPGPNLSTTASSVDANELEGPLLSAERQGEEPSLGLSHRNSIEVAQLSVKHDFNEDRWPRRMSFGDAEEAVLTWNEIIDMEEKPEGLSEALAMAEFARQLNQHVEDITTNVEPWVEEKVKAVGVLDERYARDKEDIQILYHQLSEACERVRYSSAELLGNERTSLTESVKDIDLLLARLEYEIDGLNQKVGDVEDGIQNFERQVEDVEKRAADLKVQLETETWLHWFVRTLTGVGTGPNITQTQP